MLPLAQNAFVKLHEMSASPRCNILVVRDASSPPSLVVNSTVLLGGPSKRLLATTMNILYLE